MLIVNDSEAFDTKDLRYFWVSNNFIKFYTNHIDSPCCFKFSNKEMAEDQFKRIVKAFKDEKDFLDLTEEDTLNTLD